MKNNRSLSKLIGRAFSIGDGHTYQLKRSFNAITVFKDGSYLGVVWSIENKITVLINQLGTMTETNFKRSEMTII